MKKIAATLLSIAIFVFLNAGLFWWKSADNIAANKKDDIAISKLRDAVLNSPSESAQSGPWPWWVARAYFLTPAPDIVVLGDSQMNAAFIQADAMTTENPKDCTVDRSCIALKEELAKYSATSSANPINAVNLSLGGAMPSDYYLMTKAFFSTNNHPKIVVIGVSPRSYIDTTLESASATETFQFLAPQLDLGRLADLAFTNPIEEYFWLIRNKYTLFAYQQNIAMKVYAFFMKHFPVNDAHKIALEKNANVPGNNHALGSIYSGNGFIPLGSNVVGPNPSIPFKENMAEYKRRFAHLNPTTLNNQSAYFEATLAYLNKLGVKVIVVEMPMLQPVRELLPLSFWQTYHMSLANVCKENQAILVDLSDSKDFPQSEYIDYVHLNATGGKHFTNQLARYIKQDSNLM